MAPTTAPSHRIGSLFLAVLVAGSVACCGLAAASVGAGTRSAQRRSELEAIAVHVVDRDGRPIAGLAKDEIELAIDGRPRTIESVEYVSVAPSAPAAGSGTSASFYGTSEWTPPGRLIVLVIDQGHLRSGGQRSVFAAASAFLDLLHPADRVAVVSIPPGRATLAPTTDRVRVRGALDVLVGQARRAPSSRNVSLADALALEDGDTRWDGVLQRECDDRVGDETLLGQCRQSVEQAGREIVGTARQASSQTLQALEQVFTWLTEVEGPKSVLLLTEGMITGTVRSPVVVADPNRLREAAAASGAAFSALRLGGRLFDMSESRPSGSGGEDEELNRLGLDILAARLGGPVFPLSSSSDAVLARVAAETSAYYRLVFEPWRGERDGKPRRFEVRVRRAGAVVRTAGGLVAFRPAAQASAEQVLLGALQSPVPARDLPVTLATYAVRRREGTMRVVLAAGIDRAVKGPREIRTGLLVLSPQGQVTASAVDTQTLQVVGGGDQAHLLYTASWEAGPGSYLLKFAALDRDGRIGVAERHLTIAPSPAVPRPSTSDLMLFDGPVSTSPSADGVVAAPTLRLQVEVYGLPAGDPAVRFEVGRPAIAAALRRAEPTLSRPDDGSRVVADAQLGLGDLPPGEYVARVIVTLPGAPPLEISRPFSRPVGAQTSAAPVADTRHAAAVALPAEHPTIERASAYVRTYVTALSTVVCQERYEQNLRRQTDSLGISRSVDSERRTIVSDLVFVQLPGAAEWSTFRDVYSVDGKPVRDREDRLADLFVKPSVDRWQQLQRIRDESSRHNMGAAIRDINIPTFALQFLLPGVREHFVFDLRGRERVDGVEAEVFSYRETGRPTAIRGRYNEDVPAVGQVWIEPVHGTILRTRLETRMSGGQSRIDVAFRPNEKLGLWLPASMEERNAVPGEDLRGQAEYSNFRQFKVETTEQIK